MKKLVFTAFAVGLGLTANVMAQVPSYVPTNGLVGWWPFNGNANDESGNGNNGTVNGATLTTDRFGNVGKAYSFDGNDFIQCGQTSAMNNTSNWSIFSWVKVSSFNSWINCNDGCGMHFVSRDRDITASHYSLSAAQNQSNGTINLYSIDGNLSSNFNISVPMTNWMHFGIRKTNTSVELIVNGTIVSSALDNSSIGSSAGNLFFGKHFGDGFGNYLYYMKGNLDDIGIWNRALTECEIQDLYNSQINSVAGSISVSPNSASIGSNVTLSTTTNSTNVQWQTNGVNLGWQNVPSNSSYSGGTTNTLTVNNVQLSNHNQPFRVIASNGNCTDTSNVASIQISDTCITNVTVYDTLLTTVTDTLIINTTLSLPAPNNENTILIYPNPASDHITIDNGNFAAMVGYSIKIENNAGQQVFQSAINQQQFYVDLSSWTGNGLYFVHLIDPQNNTVTVRKIVLQ